MHRSALASASETFENSLKICFVGNRECVCVFVAEIACK